MEFSKLFEIAKKHVDTTGLLKDLAGELVLPAIDAFEAKVQSKEVDLIPGTDIDAAIVTAMCEAFKKFVVQG